MSAAEKILERLGRVKKVGTDRWLAKCPAHEDKSPSLSITDKGDGRVLVHCFAGCEVGNVLAAIGLRVTDLFDRPLDHHYTPTRNQRPASERLQAAVHPVWIIALLCEQYAIGMLTDEDALRLRSAALELIALVDPV